MQINTSYQHLPYQSNIQTQYLKDADIGDKTKEEENAKIQASIPPLGEISRQTYGLSVLEQMSDDEYRAFLRATVDMSESEKIFAAQSLYRLNEVYREKIGYRNPYQGNQKDFVQAFKNAYAEILSQKI